MNLIHANTMALLELYVFLKRKLNQVFVLSTCLLKLVLDREMQLVCLAADAGIGNIGDVSVLHQSAGRPL